MFVKHFILTSQSIYTNIPLFESHQHYKRLIEHELFPHKVIMALGKLNNFHMSHSIAKWYRYNSVFCFKKIIPVYSSKMSF